MEKTLEKTGSLSQIITLSLLTPRPWACLLNHLHRRHLFFGRFPHCLLYLDGGLLRGLSEVRLLLVQSLGCLLPPLPPAPPLSPPPI